MCAGEGSFLADGSVDTSASRSVDSIVMYTKEMTTNTTIAESSHHTSPRSEIIKIEANIMRVYSREKKGNTALVFSCAIERASKGPIEADVAQLVREPRRIAVEFVDENQIARE